MIYTGLENNCDKFSCKVNYFLLFVSNVISKLVEVESYTNKMFLDKTGLNAVTARK